jgi:hypothetical protein
MLDLVCLSFLYLPFISYFQQELLGEYNEHIQTSHTSSLHATYVCACYLAYMFMPIDSPRLFFLNLACGASIAFSLYDIPYYIKHYSLKPYYKYMILHHLILLSGSVITYYCGIVYHISDPDFMTLVAGCYLSELSTPLLNYIQINHGNVGITTKIGFTVLYFIVRPLNLTHFTYKTLCKFGLFHFNSLLSLTLSALNYVWFVQILQKAKKSIEIDAKEHP